jgi:uncharacterized protein (DUF1697 family)
MNKKIAILRGINVGGKRKILMADLKVLFKGLGFENIATYIQSGNVIFDSNNNLSEIEIADKIEIAIKEKYDFDVPVIVTTHDFIQNAIHNNPFNKAAETDIKQLHLTFLQTEPTAENLAHLHTFNYEPDEFNINKKAVFIFCKGKYHQSKLTNNFFEKKLKVRATTRNWKTVLKLLELSQS